MAVITAPAGTRTSHAITGFNSLGSATYAASTASIDVSATDPIDVVVEVEATPGTVAGSKQILVFVKVSMDNTNFSTGPESGVTATDEPNLRFLGALPVNTNATAVLTRASTRTRPLRTWPDPETTRRPWSRTVAEPCVVSPPSA